MCVACISLCCPGWPFERCREPETDVTSGELPRTTSLGRVAPPGVSTGERAIRSGFCPNRFPFFPESDLDLFPDRHGLPERSIDGELAYSEPRRQIGEFSTILQLPLPSALLRRFFRDIPNPPVRLRRNNGNFVSFDKNVHLPRAWRALADDRALCSLLFDPHRRGDPFCSLIVGLLASGELTDVVPPVGRQWVASRRGGAT